MKKICILFLGALLTGCSVQMRMESPLKMSEGEFNKRVAELVNPSLAHLNQRVDSLDPKNEKNK